METELRRICELQTAYSSANTPEMKERGTLIRSTLPKLLREYQDQFELTLGRFDAEVGIEGSDGIGRKTEAPWVRIFAPKMSPSPREGYYVVMHFAADGSAMFVTVGCGSTIWNGGDLKPISDRELARRTEWARSAVRKAFATIEPFSDGMHLGARAALPRTFEKATAISKRVSRDEITTSSISSLVVAAVERLGSIYLAQSEGRDTDPAQDALQVVEALSRPRANLWRQGMGLSATERRAVELHAMHLARKWLEAEGFSVTDVSASEPFDFRAVRDGEEIKIEVKGTTSEICDSVMMTRNEVALHRAEKGSTGLIIVSGIGLRRGTLPISADSGSVEALLGWDIDHWTQSPIAYQITRST